jgi:hypothetical protein
MGKFERRRICREKLKGNEENEEWKTDKNEERRKMKNEVGMKSKNGKF